MPRPLPATGVSIEALQVGLARSNGGHSQRKQERRVFMSQSTQGVVGKHTGQLGAPPLNARVPTGVFATLVEQHRHVAELLILAGTTEAPAKRSERWAEARRRLLSHERAEALEVYAVLASNSSAKEMLEQHAQQGAELESAIAELDATAAESDEWIERLRDVIAMVEDHVRDEESDFFPRAQALLGDSTSRDLDERFQSAQREVLHTLP
jgi:hemerythrin superfamily protein